MSSPHAEAAHALLSLAWNTDFSDDLDGYVDLLTDDVEMRVVKGPTDETVTSGKEEVRRSVAVRCGIGGQGPSSGCVHFIGSVTVLDAAADTVRASSAWTYVGQDGAAPARGSYENLLRRVDGQLRLVERTTRLAPLWSDARCTAVASTGETTPGARCAVVR